MIWTRTTRHVTLNIRGIVVALLSEGKTSNRASLNNRLPCRYCSASQARKTNKSMQRVKIVKIEVNSFLSFTALFARLTLPVWLSVILLFLKTERRAFRSDWTRKRCILRKNIQPKIKSVVTRTDRMRQIAVNHRIFLRVDGIDWARGAIFRSCNSRCTRSTMKVVRCIRWPSGSCW